MGQTSTQDARGQWAASGISWAQHPGPQVGQRENDTSLLFSAFGTHSHPHSAERASWTSRRLEGSWKAGKKPVFHDWGGAASSRVQEAGGQFSAKLRLRVLSQLAHKPLGPPVSHLGHSLLAWDPALQVRLSRTAGNPCWGSIPLGAVF